MDQVENTIRRAENLRKAAEDHRKLANLKGNEEFLTKIEELILGITAQRENILLTAQSSTGVMACLTSIESTLVATQDFFDEVSNTTVLFFSKTRLKRKMKSLQQSLQSTSTQLMTSITLELLMIQSANKAEKPTPLDRSVDSKSIKTTNVEPAMEERTTPTTPHVVVERSVPKAAAALPDYVSFLYGLDGRPRNYSRAFAAAVTAAEGGDAGAMRVVANCFADGLGVGEDPTRRAAWMERAAHLGDVEAKVRLAECALDALFDTHSACLRLLGPQLGDGENKSFGSSLGGDDDAYHRGRDISMWSGPEDKIGGAEESELGDDILSKTKQDADLDDFHLGRAVNLLVEAAAGGAVDAERKLGQLAEQALNYEQAQKWYALAAGHGCAKATTRLGMLYLEGRGVARQRDTAYGLFLEASAAGDPEGSAMAAMCLERGWGTGGGRSVEAAMGLYRRAAEGGWVDAQLSLGYILVRQYVDLMREIGAGGGSGSRGSKSTSLSTMEGSYVDDSAEGDEDSEDVTQAQEGGGVGALDLSLQSLDRHVIPEGGQGGTVRVSPRDAAAARGLATEGINWLRRASEGGVAEAAYHLGSMYEQVRELSNRHPHNNFLPIPIAHPSPLFASTIAIIM